jgi:glutamyl-tRNA reductase
MLIANRTHEKAARLAQRFEAECVSFTPKLPNLLEVDLVVASTGAAGHVLGRPEVEAAMRARPERPLVLLDLAVPPDVDPDCAQLRNVTVIGIDAVAGLARDRQGTPAEASARHLVEEETGVIMAEARSTVAVPTILALSAHAEAIRIAELDRLAARFQDADETQREAIALLSRRLVKKLNHRPFLRLKELAGTNQGDDYARVVQDLFGLTAK